MEAIKEIESIKYDLSKVSSELEAYNIESFKDSWGGEICEEFSLKLRRTHNILDDLIDEVTKLGTYIAKYGDEVQKHE
jgi:hypothetical protein